MKIKLKAMLQFIAFGILTVILFYTVCIWLPTHAKLKSEEATIRPAEPMPYLPMDETRENIQGWIVACIPHAVGLSIHPIKACEEMAKQIFHEVKPEDQTPEDDQ